MRALTAFLKSLPAGMADDIRAELEAAAKKVAQDTIAAACARLLVKGTDSAIAIAVKHLPENQVDPFAEAYDESVAEELAELQQALAAYAPLQCAVELAKKKHGNKSTEANEARKRREIGLSGFRSEIKDVVLSVSGGEPTD